MGSGSGSILGRGRLPVLRTILIADEVCDLTDLSSPGRRGTKGRAANAAPDAHAAIDTAYHAKYDRCGPTIVGTVGPQTEAVTLRLLPRNS